MFEHLDDPTPPVPGDTARVTAVARGAHLRHRRRTAWVGGTAMACALALGVAYGGLPETGGNQVVAVGDSPSGVPTVPVGSPTASPDESPSPEPRESDSPSSSPSATRPTAPPGGIGPLPVRPARERIAPCSRAETAEAHPAGTTPPRGVGVTADFQRGTVEATSRGAYWAVRITVSNRGPAPVTFVDEGRAAVALLDRTLVTKADDGDGMPTTPASPVEYTIEPGGVQSFETRVPTVECGSPRRTLPWGTYTLHVGIRTDQGVWYAPGFTGWVTDVAAEPCFRLPALSGQAPVAGLTLAATVLSRQNLRALDPDAALVARVTITNTARRAAKVAEQAGSRLAYLVRDGQVTGGWTTSERSRTLEHTIPARDSITIDVPVSSEGCVTDEPQEFGPRNVVAGLLVQDDGGGWYHWTTRATPQVSYRS